MLFPVGVEYREPLFLEIYVQVLLLAKPDIIEYVVNIPSEA